MTETMPTVHLPVYAEHRTEQYWQSLALYAITLIIYAVFRALWNSTLQSNGEVTVDLSDPIVVLLSIFVLFALITLIVNAAAERTIAVGESGITFTSRIHERTFAPGEIESISFGHERRVRVRGVFSVVRVRIKGRRRALRIRPSLYSNTQELSAALLMLRKMITKTP
jgi:hypothetical protein